MKTCLSYIAHYSLSLSTKQIENVCHEFIKRLKEKKTQVKTGTPPGHDFQREISTHAGDTFF